jgi:hypothetical protein
LPRISARSAATIRRKFPRGINAALLQTSEDVLARNYACVRLANFKMNLLCRSDEQATA